MANEQQIELLQAEVDENDQSFFRLLVNGQSIKYITVEPGIYSTEEMCFGPSLISILPDFPSGDWNEGLVSRDANDTQPCFTSIKWTQFPGVQDIWHGTQVDYLDLTVERKLRTGVYKVKCPQYDNVVVAKFARFPWEVQYIGNETTAYQWISGHGIGPGFLGHVTESGRVIGFLIEYIGGARHAGIRDVESCREVLGRLHDLGVCHGDTNAFNFLICGGKATLIDFDTARKCNDRVVLVQEMDGLAACLDDRSGRGGGGLL
ncbi:alpha-galactosidase A precursor [Aspergillus vadensis CBS 113365]|uniref:Alpha-galactosidase A n=1 Tax=Aspergillus vadensis (strain CBS 113365 / IMI 142717 / IBT 24658) TaxID=1448311 RepID=A0A319C7I1_ASPVC|nr:alpha-galactosidase A precursor [Aspergillus vadensis CBS 113365]PYH74393.1 alpha-galactosidase A precursor [Aspergillus vadensis CBS 113365]